MAYKVTVYILRTDGKREFFADETERDLMAKAAVQNGKTAFKSQFDVEPTAKGFAHALNNLLRL